MGESNNTNMQSLPVEEDVLDKYPDEVVFGDAGGSSYKGEEEDVWDD